MITPVASLSPPLSLIISESLLSLLSIKVPSSSPQLTACVHSACACLIFALIRDQFELESESAEIVLGLEPEAMVWQRLARFGTLEKNLIRVV
jgi:hypothetical protein